MADQGMDPCECIWRNELAMRRLISFLRHGQSYCTDSECLEALPGSTPSPDESGFLMMTVFLAIALLMYFFSPRMSRRRRDYDEKPSFDHGPPPPPAAPIN